MKKGHKKESSNSNFLLRLFSIFVAVVAWFVVVQVENPDDLLTIKDIKIDAMNTEVIEKDNLIFYGFGEDEVTVRFSGGKVNLGKLREYAERITATVDIKDYYGSAKYIGEDGLYLLIKINIPDNMQNLVKIDRKSLEYVLVKIDEKATYSKDVEVDLKIGVSDNYYVDSSKVKILPQKVDVVGAKSIIEKIANLKTEVTVSSINGEIKDSLVRAYDKDGKIVEGVKISPEKVQVQVPVLTKKSVKLNLNVKNNLPEGLEFEAVKIMPNELIVAGTEEIISKLEDNLSIEIELETVEGNYTQVKEVVLNEALVNVNDVDKVNIAYTISKSVNN